VLGLVCQALPRMRSTAAAFQARTPAAEARALLHWRQVPVD